MNIFLENIESDLNKSTNVNTDQASNTKYPSVKAVFDWATNLFFPKPTGTTAEYLRGDGSVATFPSIPSIAGLVPETRTVNGRALSTDIDISLFPLFCSKNITNTATSGSVRYTGFIDGSGVQTTDIHKIVIPIDTTYFNFYILTGTSQPATGSSVFTIIKNGTDTGVVVTIPAGSGAGVFVDSVNTLSVVAGDIISIKWVNNASTTSCRADSFTMASK